MRKLLINILYISGLFQLVYLYNRMAGRFPILVFHRVTPIGDELTEPLSPMDFEKIMMSLKKKYSFCELEHVDHFGSPCVITFDDATTDFHDHALEILIKHEIPTILFIPTEAACSGDEIWTNKLFSQFRHNQRQTIEFDLEEKNFRFALSDRDGVKKLRDLIKRLNQLAVEDRNKKINEITGLLEGKDYSPHTSTLAWSRLRTIRQNRMARKLVALGSHSHTHPCLTSINNCALRDELITSKAQIERELGSEIFSIAYPFGLANDGIRLEASKYYQYGFSTSGESAKRHRLHDHNYRLSIPRISVYTRDPKELFLRINGLEAMVTLFRRLSRVLSRRQPR